MAYTYDPTLQDQVSKMRFELGDTAVSGGAKSCMLSDEEINAIIGIYPKWRMAKFKLVESVCMRFSAEVQTSGDGLTLGTDARAERWSQLYKELKKEASMAAAPSVKTSGNPYFTTGMMQNPRTDGIE